MIFRAVWPILDDGTTYRDLVRAAKAEVPLLAAQAHAKLTGPGRFSIADAIDVPGCGRTTDAVLVFEAPAIEVPRRRLWAVA